MTDDLLSKVCWIGDAYVVGPIRGIVLRFAGLGGVGSGPDPADLEWGNAGALVVYPNHNPWAWMNPDTVAFVDEVVYGLRARYNLGADMPLISTGGSMGGHAALLYPAKSRHQITRAYANCPVSDLLYHYSERPDLPRTMHSAFRSYEDITEILKDNSPLHLAETLPKIPYLIVHGGKDKAVNKNAHSDALVAALRSQNSDVTYLELPNMEHCNPMDYVTYRSFVDFVLAGL